MKRGIIAMAVLLVAVVFSGVVLAEEVHISAPKKVEVGKVVNFSIISEDFGLLYLPKKKDQDPSSMGDWAVICIHDGKEIPIISKQEDGDENECTLSLVFEKPGKYCIVWVNLLREAMHCIYVTE